MELNADFSENIVIRPSENAWTPSPTPGVERMMLDRIGGEVARATSIVRFAPGSAFAAHTHGGGEEYFVLEGVFSDEDGDFPVGSYVRNPPTSSHTPASEPGCVIFVKLWQMQAEDREQVRINTNNVEMAEIRSGVAVARLYEDAFERVRIERWAPAAAARIDAEGGAEILVIDGAPILDGEPLAPWSWIRRADGQSIDLETGAEGARLWIKTGHLRHAARSPA